LTAIPEENSEFAGWKMDCENCGSSAECEIGITSDKKCEAVFVVVEPEPDALSDTPVTADVADESTDVSDIVSVDTVETVDIIQADAVVIDDVSENDIRTNDVQTIAREKEKERGCSCSLIE
ncbi:MAG: hypothetical protein N3B13_11405, partial [Deltaproteobacteria bacterium]|nr:hypothetical protein [Deltaproteobacteria bacterium]